MTKSRAGLNARRVQAIVSGDIAPPACVTYRSDGSGPSDDMSTCPLMSSNVAGTPAKPVQASSAIASRTTRGYMKRSSMKTDAPAKRCVCSTLRP